MLVGSLAQVSPPFGARRTAQCVESLSSYLLCQLGVQTFWKHCCSSLGVLAALVSAWRGRRSWRLNVRRNVLECATTNETYFFFAFFNHSNTVAPSGAKLWNCTEQKSSPRRPFGGWAPPLSPPGVLCFLFYDLLCGWYGTRCAPICGVHGLGMLLFKGCTT